MDLKKLNIPTLEGPNWGGYAPKLQAAFRIFDCWDAVKGKILTPPPNPTYNLLTKPAAPPANASAADLATYQTAKQSGQRRTPRHWVSCKQSSLLSFGKNMKHRVLPKTSTTRLRPPMDKQEEH